MSYHRVLPPLPPSICKQGLSVAQDQESLLDKIMATQALKPSTEKTSIRSSEDTLSPLPGYISPSQRLEEVPEVDVDFPKVRTCSLPQAIMNCGERDQREGKPLSSNNSKSGSVLWRSEICLCQPDPKIPRPRNGKSTACELSDGEIS